MKEDSSVFLIASDNIKSVGPLYAEEVKITQVHLLENLRHPQLSLVKFHDA